MLAILCERRHIGDILLQCLAVSDVTAYAFADALRDRYRLERKLGRGGMADQEPEASLLVPSSAGIVAVQ